jgi:hypothetical protein
VSFRVFLRGFLPTIATGVACMACMSAPISERVRLYNAESPTTGPAGVPGSGGTGAAGSFGSGGTMGGTTAEAAQETPGNESLEPKHTVFVDGGPSR